MSEMHGEFSWTKSPDLTGPFTLLPGDCLKVMRTLPNSFIDMAYIGLPYATTAHKWDIKINLEKMWKQINRIMKPGAAICFLCDYALGVELHTSNPGGFKFQYTWIKPQGTDPMNCHKKPLNNIEHVSVFCCGAKNLRTYNPLRGRPTTPRDSFENRMTTLGPLYGDNTYSRHANSTGDDGYPLLTLYGPQNRERRTGEKHGTPNPVWLAEYMCRTFSKEGDYVLDITAGSGSSIIAAFNSGRRGIGIERDPDIFNTALKRIQNAASMGYDAADSFENAKISTQFFSRYAKDVRAAAAKIGA